MKGKNRTITIICLGLLSAIGPFSIDMYLPGFPAIAKNLHTSVDQVALSLSSYFIGISIGQLLYGPLLDRLGRKKPLYAGLIIYMIASLGCALAASVNQLIVLRFLQALGGCVGMVASRALVRDLFTVEESPKVFSSLMLVIGVSPLVAPALGSYLTATIGWHYIFIFLAVLVFAILLITAYGLPSGRVSDPYFSLKPLAILKNFITVLKQPQFLIYTLTGAIGSAGLYAYIAGSPNVFIKIFNISEKYYGYVFALNAFGLIGCSQLNSLALRKYTSAQLVRIALIAQCTVGVCLFSGTALGILDLVGTCVFSFLFLCAQGFIFPNASALSMAPFAKNAGSASAVMGALQMGIGALASACVSIFSDGSARPMTGTMMCCTLGGLTVLLIGRTILKRRQMVDTKDEKVIISEHLPEVSIVVANP
jgi:MFS transporter, DHA1 family, multidrug resistance protein